MTQKIKNKHNKKRNTAFLFESLSSELTKCVVEKRDDRRQKVMDIIKNLFYPTTEMSRELRLYRDIYESVDLSRNDLEKIITTASIEHRNLDQKKLFQEQSQAIKKINVELGKEVFNNFVPNYKCLATISQMFGATKEIKGRVLLESKVADIVSEPKTSEQKTIDNVTLKTFIGKFNEEYSGLLSEQKSLLNKYVLSFLDNGIDYKIHLNREVSRLKAAINESFSSKEVESDNEMKEKSKQVLLFLEDLQKQSIDNVHVLKILKIQQLVEELGNDD